MELAEEVEEGAFGLLDGTDPLVASLRSEPGGQEGTGLTSGVKSSGRRNSPSSNSGSKSGEVGPGLRGKGLGELPGCLAVLLRGFAGVEAR